MLRLDVSPSIVYCVNGTKLPPMGVTEEFLSKQIQLGLADLVSILIKCLEQVVQPRFESLNCLSEADYALNLEQFDQIYQQYKSKLL